MKSIITKNIQAAQILYNTHVANYLLSKANDKFNKKPIQLRQTGKGGGTVWKKWVNMFLQTKP